MTGDLVSGSYGRLIRSLRLAQEGKLTLPNFPVPAPAADAGLRRLRLTPTTPAFGGGPPPPEGEELRPRWPVLGPGAL